jgi:AcrR family transcriptional regulator
MTAKIERTVRKPAGDRRREIADAALRVIAVEGLGRFTAVAIAREVGLTDGALFRHFPSKEAIVDAAIDRVEELLFEGHPPAADDPIDRLGAFFRARVAVIRDNPGISPLLMSDELAKAASADGVKRVADMRRRSTGFVRSCIAEAERRKALAAGLRAEEASVVVLGSLLALAHSATVVAEPVSTVAPRVWIALEKLLRRPQPRRSTAGRRSPPRTERHHPRGDAS